MSSKIQAAEKEFRQTFERLKANKPERLQKGSDVTQNNVARGAGSDPSALRKQRHPSLNLEIQAYTAVISSLRPNIESVAIIDPGARRNS